MRVIPLGEIVAAGLCIGCGLCRSIAPDAVEIRLTAGGEERPFEVGPLREEALALINAVCPGLRVELAPTDAPVDPMWGPVLRLARGYAADAKVRFVGATGGVLSALGRYVLQSGRVEEVLHVAPRADDPLYWEARVSTTPEEIMAGAGSRYGPAAPLTGLVQLLDEGRPVALIAKPCDAAAVRNLVAERPGYQDIVRYLLVLACGGASKMTKNWALLDDFGVGRDEVAVLRHRGYGNPGPTVVTARDGRRHETTYLALWEDAGTWDLQWRCKICPDGMGEVADVVALDCWPGGAPAGEDAGFNGIIARTPAGAELLAAAAADGAIVITDDGLPVDETLESWQPHQSRRKAAVPSRLRAMAAEGLPTLEAPGLRLRIAEERMSGAARDAEFEGARARIRPVSTSVIITGTGTPMYEPGRAGPGVLVRAGSAALQFDAGRATTLRLAEAGFNLRDLTAVFVTHHHSDHLVGLPDLAMTWWLEGDPADAAPLPVVVPAGPAADLVAGMLGVWQAEMELRASHTGRAGVARLDVRRFTATGEAQQVLEVDDVTVLAVAVRHEPVVPAVAYRVDAPDGAVVISGDTAVCPELEALASGADVLVHEAFRTAAVPPGMLSDPAAIAAYHADTVELGALARRAGVGTLVLTHLIPPPRRAADAAGFEHDVRRGGFTGRVLVANDLEAIP